MSDLLNILLKRNLLTETQAKEIEKESKETGQILEEIISKRKLLSEEEWLIVKEELFHLPSIDLIGRQIEKEVLEIIPQHLAKNYQMVAFDKTSQEMSLAMVNPGDFKAREAAEFIAREKNLKIKYYVTTPTSFRSILNQYETLIAEVEEALVTAKGKFKPKPEEKIVEKKEFEEIIKSAPVSKIVSALLRYAIEGRASDIHIEPLPDKTRVRYRVDGILYTSLFLPKYIHAAVVSRIKVLANLKLDETRLPQDGRIRMKIDDKKIDLRISTLPLIDNEKVVMRVLDVSEKVPTLEKLGFWGQGLEVMKKNIKNPHGMFLVTGPTGSGKSTTLYAVLNTLNKEGVNIITLEDPVEYYLEGINQSQINPSIGLTFAKALRSVVRQDPNVIMVGEIRDNETAELAIHASLTGHIVLSTLHTNDAFGAIPRLIDMKAEPFLIVSSVNAVIAQRLVKKICPDCRKKISLSESLKEKIIKELDQISNLKEYRKEGTQNLALYQGKGCPHCAKKGTFGRIAIFEVLAMTENLQRIIVSGCKAEEIREEFKKQNMISMKQDGLLKALQGLVTLEEVMVVTHISR
jgi:type IV pilus assembly protein PilB